MGCDECREAISAELDGEGLPGAEADVAAHLERCADCRWFADRAARVTRLTRTRVAEPSPDVVAAVLAAAPPIRRRRRTVDGVVRAGLGVVGIGQFALGVNGVVGAGAVHDHGAALAGASIAHFAHESSAWNLALAVGFLWAATGGPRVSGLLPVVGAFVGVLSLLSVLDVAAGRVEPARLLSHGLVVVGMLLLIALRRSTPRDGGSATRPAVPGRGGSNDGGDRTGPRTWRPNRRGTRGAQTAQRRVA